MPPQAPPLIYQVCPDSLNKGMQVLLNSVLFYIEFVEIFIRKMHEYFTEMHKKTD